MTKLEWIQGVSHHLGVTHEKAQGLWDFLETQTLAELHYPHGSGVALVPGVGKLKRVYRAPKRSRNPRTNEAVDVPAKVAVKLVPGRGIREFLNPDLAGNGGGNES